MQISKNNKNELVLTFDYNAALVEIVKHFDSRKYDNETKEWTVPVLHVVQVLDTLTPLGFHTSLEVLEEYDKAKKKKKKIKRIREGDFKDSEIEIFKLLNLPLFGFQEIGAGFLVATKSSLLGDEPGCGKSIQSIATVLIRKAKKILILCPSTLKLNWKDEIEKWASHKTSIVIGGDKKLRAKQWNQDVDFYIMNYELLLRDMDYINKIEWDFLIADEATRISNPKAKQSKNIKKIKAKYRIALTGTPLNNAVQDVWNILDFCQPNLLGTFWQFTQKYCDKDRFGGITGYKNLSELKKHISDNMLRRKKKDVLNELPDKLYETLYIEFDPEEKKIYEAIRDEIAADLNEYNINRVLKDRYLSNVLVKMVRLKQAADSLELVSEHTFSSKTNALKELLKDIIHKDDKALVFTQFSEMADILMRELKEYRPLLISGKVKQEDRHMNVDTFQNKEENKLMIMTEAGGFGLNLQRANYIIHYDLPWSISKMEQREGRAHRIGQTSNLTVYRLIAQDTVDEYVLKVLHKKQKLSEEILGDREKAKKIKISKADIRRMLKITK
ncbi:MAG: SNF2-related protein [Patescibacteria group bacterium]|nr:SNF2-related protein [Patescibacteria group bacterium]